MMQPPEEAPTFPFALNGFADHLGVRVVEWPDGAPCIALTIRPEFLNRNGAVHGGVILTLLDTVCSLSGLRFADGVVSGRVVAVSLTTNFISPAHNGVLYAKAKSRGGGTKLLMVDGEVVDEHGRLIATAASVVRRIQESAN